VITAEFTEDLSQILNVVDDKKEKRIIGFVSQLGYNSGFRKRN